MIRKLGAAPGTSVVPAGAPFAHSYGRVFGNLSKAGTEAARRGATPGERISEESCKHEHQRSVVKQEECPQLDRTQEVIGSSRSLLLTGGLARSWLGRPRLENEHRCVGRSGGRPSKRPVHAVTIDRKARSRGER